jgi:chromosomal replication initiation ATPase DnaA
MVDPLATRKALRRSATMYGVSVSDILGASRQAGSRHTNPDRPIIQARRYVMASLWAQGLSFGHIGRKLGRHHTTVMHNVIKAKEMAHA